MIILLLNSHLWEMTDAKYYLYSATLFIYCPILSTGCNNYYNYYYETIYSLCIPLPKSFTSVIYLIQQQINCDFTIIYHLFIEMVFYFYLSECLHPQFRSGLWFTGSFTMAYVHSSLILRCIKMTSQSSVNLGCASCLLQCTQTSGQLNYKTEQYISNVYLLPIRLKVRTIS